MPNSDEISQLLHDRWGTQAEINGLMKVRRALVSRLTTATMGNQTGTILPPPFDESLVTIKAMLGEMAKAVQISTSRLTANGVVMKVVPLSLRTDINETVEKMSGEQERLDSQLWYECGGMDAQWNSAWAKSVTGVAFLLTLPRDATFGLPSRRYYSESDEDLQRAMEAGIVSPFPREVSGKMIYAEDGDVWAGRRKDAAKARSINGRDLFTIQVYPRDMVIKERDSEAKDLKWGAVIEDIPAASCAPGSDFAMAVAKKKGLSGEDVKRFGVFWDKKDKCIIGGISQGQPLDSANTGYDSFTLIRWFDRKDQVILIAPRGSVQGATEIWRGAHGCTVQGQPACPLIEDPFYRTDISTIGQEYSTAIDEVFAYVPPMNQLMTIMSNIAIYNGTPRLVGKLAAGQDLRGDSGEPMAGDSAPVPGLNANEIAFYPGDVTQLTIQAGTILDALKIYFERLDRVMPALGAAASGADAAGWAIMQRVQESQQPFLRPVENFCQAVTGVVQRWHGWMRPLDVPIYFYAAPGHRKTDRDIRGLIEFDPKNLTDSIVVTQDVYTASEQTVREQIQMQKWQAKLIDDEQYYESTNVQDPRAAVTRRWVQVVVDYVMTGVLPPPPPGTTMAAPSIVQMVGDGVRGTVHYELINRSPNYAIGVAEQIAAQSHQAGAMGMGGEQPGVLPEGQGNIAHAAGVRAPGVEMSTTLQGQLGPSAPNGVQPGMK